MRFTLTCLDATLVAVLTAWLALTVAGQFCRNPRIWRRDVFSVIPRWAFFAGAPIRVDYSILFRDHLRDGSCGPWREVPFTRRRAWWHVFFDPASRCRRVARVLTVQALGASQTGAVTPHDSPHYRALMRATLSFPAAEDARAREAIIIRSFGLIPDRLPQAIVRFALQPIPTGQSS